MTETNSWCLVIFFCYVTEVILLLSHTHSFADIGLSGLSTDVTATESGCLNTSLSHTKRLTTSLVSKHDATTNPVCTPAYMPFSRGTGCIHWSRLALIDTSSRPHDKML